MVLATLTPPLIREGRGVPAISQLSDGGAAAWLAVAAALLISVGTASTDPTPSTILALLALVVSATAALGFGTSVLGRLRERSVVTILTVGVVLEIMIGILAPAVLDVRFMVLFAAAGAIALYALHASGLRQRLALVAVVALHFGLMIWMFAAVPVVGQDMPLVHEEASAALLRGVNPYSITFENIYGYGTPFYPIELQDGDRLLFGFPYPPLSLLMSLPGFILAGDYRVAALAAISIAALLIGHMRTGPLAVGAALLLLLSPLTARVLHNGWTEPFVVVWLAVTVYLAVRRLATTAVALGLLIATKQYMPLLLPIAMGLLSDVRSRIGTGRMLTLTIGVAVATAVPFVVWGPADLVLSTVVTQLLQPFREDGATVPALLARLGLWVPPVWLGLAVAGAIFVVVMRKAARTPTGFALASAVVLMGLFLFTRNAFMNYYFAVMVALLCGVAASEAADGA